MTARMSAALKLSVALSALALVAAPLSAQAASCFDEEVYETKAGATSAVVGPDIGISRDGYEDFARPDVGDDVFSEDLVRTGDESHLQLKFCDWSTYTFLPNSESQINEIYDDEGAGGRRVVNFIRGGFRLTSGKNSEPGDTEVRIQESGVTMGVRGTSVLIVELDGEIFVLLEGPGGDNNGLQLRGRVEFINEQTREKIKSNLRAPGWVVTIGPDGGVSDPFEADADLLERIYDAFVPVIPDENGGGGSRYAADGNGGADGAGAGPDGGSPADGSGQRDQEGGDALDTGDELSDTDNRTTDNYPNEPAEEDGATGRMELASDILAIEELDAFGALQTPANGHFVAVAPAVVKITDSGAIAEHGGRDTFDSVALIQMEVDFINRIFAPEGGASFVKFDVSVDDPSDLSAEAGAPPSFDFDDDDFKLALISSTNLSFDDSVAASFADYDFGLYRFKLRNDGAGTVLLDIIAEFSGPFGDGTLTATARADDLNYMPGPGDLVYFDTEIGPIFDADELDGLAGLGAVYAAGFSDVAAKTLGGAALLDGVGFAEMAVDFANRTIGGELTGGSMSFIAVTVAEPGFGGAVTTRVVRLDRKISFDDGLYGIALFDIAPGSSDANLKRGVFSISEDAGGVMEASLSAILNFGGGEHIFTEVDGLDWLDIAYPLTKLDELDAAAAGLGAGDFNYQGALSGGLEFADDTYASGSGVLGLDINFASRTIGGGASYVQFAIPDPLGGTGPDVFSLSENIAAISFDEGADGFGVFGFDVADFSGGNVEAAMLLLRTLIDARGSDPAARADFEFTFNDGAGGFGRAGAIGLPRGTGATPSP